MNKEKLIATRESYGKAITELCSKYEDLVVLDADLAAATKTGVFKAKYPERFFDCGIAEANMIGVAAGLASTGKIPVASSFAMFAAGRAFEQVRNSVGYPKLNVKICATHAGLSVGEDGATHQCNEDIALMRTIPGMTVICPCDDLETKYAVKAALDTKGPFYIRLSRLASAQINEEGYQFKLGKGVTVREGKDITIIATGLMVERALDAAEELSKENIDARVINIHTIKPIDEEIIIKAAKETKGIVVAEEHSKIGGLTSAVCDVLCKNCPTRVESVSVNDEFGMSGPAKQVLDFYGLNSENIIAKAKEILK
ncbi:MAG: transketolase family protein [Clostridia bacterium]|nr:transketolase family protein [Clostridia bacterium]